MTRARPFPTGGGATYLQAFAVTMESGAVILARVMADGQTQGRERARAAALAAFPGGAVWDSAVYPVGPEERAKGPGLDVLKGADCLCPGCLQTEAESGFRIDRIPTCPGCVAAMAETIQELEGGTL